MADCVKMTQQPLSLSFFKRLVCGVLCVEKLIREMGDGLLVFFIEVEEDEKLLLLLLLKDVTCFIVEVEDKVVVVVVCLSR